MTIKFIDKNTLLSSDILKLRKMILSHNSSIKLKRTDSETIDRFNQIVDNVERGRAVLYVNTNDEMFLSYLYIFISPFLPMAIMELSNNSTFKTQKFSYEKTKLDSLIKMAFNYCVENQILDVYTMIPEKWFRLRMNMLNKTEVYSEICKSFNFFILDIIKPHKKSKYDFFNIVLRNNENNSEHNMICYRFSLKPEYTKLKIDEKFNIIEQ